MKKAMLSTAAILGIMLFSFAQVKPAEKKEAKAEKTSVKAEAKKSAESPKAEAKEAKAGKGKKSK